MHNLITMLSTFVVTLSLLICCCTQIYTVIDVTLLKVTKESIRKRFKYSL